MKDWKAIAEKQAEIIRHFDNKCPSMGWYEEKEKLYSELSLLESQEVEGVSSDDIIKEAHKRHPDDKEGIPDSHTYSFCEGAEWALKYAQQSSKVSDRPVCKECGKRLYCDFCHPFNQPIPKEGLKL